MQILLLDSPKQAKHIRGIPEDSLLSFLNIRSLGIKIPWPGRAVIYFTLDRELSTSSSMSTLKSRLFLSGHFYFTIQTDQSIFHALIIMAFLAHVQLPRPS